MKNFNLPSAILHATQCGLDLILRTLVRYFARGVVQTSYGDESQYVPNKTSHLDSRLVCPWNHLHNRTEKRRKPTEIASCIVDFDVVKSQVIGRPLISRLKNERVLADR